MAFQPCPGIASLTISATDSGTSDVKQNILHFQKNDLSNWAPAEIQALANNIDTWMGTSGGLAATNTYMTTAISIVNITARDLSIDGGPEYTKAVTHEGADSGTKLNSGLSFALTLRTGNSGRSFRGRIFLFGLTATVQGGSDPDAVNSTIAGNLATGWQSLITAAAGWTPSQKWVVLSRRHKVGDTPNVERTNGIGTPITSVGYSNLVIDYQRRRAPFHARHN